MNKQEGDFSIPDFEFNSGETLPELRLHYTTLGQPQYDNNGNTTNAVWIGHGTNRKRSAIFQGIVC